MILINGQVLPLNPVKNSGLEKYSQEYQNGIRDLKVRFPEGVITLKRHGFPKKAKPGQDGMLMLAEEAPPIIMKLTRPVGNDVWAYCKGAPHKDKDTGFLKVPDDNNSLKLDGETLPLDLVANEDLVFFFWFKSGQLTNFYVHEPEATRLSLLKEEQARKRVSSIILDMDEAKLEMVAMAWDVSIYKDLKKKVKKPIEFLRDDLEKRVFKMEAEKQKDKTNLMARGVDEFLADVKTDEVTRPKAIIQSAIDEGKLAYDVKNGHWYFDGNDICFVPFNRNHDRTSRQEFLAQFLRNSENADKWDYILKESVNKEYIETCDKYGKRWLAGQCEIPLNQNEEDLTKALLEHFGA